MKHRKYESYRIIDQLKTSRDAHTKYDIHHELGLHPDTAQRHLRELWTLDLVYICGWDKVNHQSIPAYRGGNKPDVERA